MPELRHLRVFAAVAEQLSFTRAAELEHMTQQTVSRTVRELERELGVTLLERTTREVRLTAAGEALLADGREALRVADAAFARAREVGTGQLGRVRVGFSPAIGPLDRDDVVRALRPPGSDVSVALHEVRPGELRPLLRSHELDVALTRASGARDDTLHSARLRPTPMVLCVPAGHRLAARASVTLADLDGERLLVASPRGSDYTDLLAGAVEAAGATVTLVEARDHRRRGAADRARRERRRGADAGRHAGARRDRRGRRRGLHGPARAAVAGGPPVGRGRAPQARAGAVSSSESSHSRSAASGSSAYGATPRYSSPVCGPASLASSK